MRTAPYLFGFLFCLLLATSARANEALWRVCVDLSHAKSGTVQECLIEKINAKEAALNKLMQERRTNARDTDASIGEDEPDSIFAVQEAQLKASHDAFMAYMNADCSRVYYGYTGGSGADTANRICQIEHLHERIRLLKAEIQ